MVFLFAPEHNLLKTPFFRKIIIPPGTAILIMGFQTAPMVRNVLNLR